MFQTLRIVNFRGFTNLKLDDLSRVNLVVGKNNTGKTSLLEAVTLLSQPTMLNSLAGLYRANSGPVGSRFYRWIRRDGCGNEDALIEAGPNEAVYIRSPTSNNPKSIVTGGSIGNEYFLLLYTQGLRPLRVRAVSVQHQTPESMVSAFSEAVRPKMGERQIEHILHSIDDRIQNIRLDTDKNPFIVIDAGLSERLPLAQAGQGIYRIVGIFSDLLGQRPEIVLIDEIENGIHYTVLPELWKELGDIATRFNIQIFATTHSRECVVAAEQAFAERNVANDLRVIQLYRISDKSDGRVLDQKHIQAAIDADIEVR